MFFAHQFRLAIRSLSKNPGFSAVAILTLALGIGACTAIFSIVDAVLVRPLPYPAANKLFLVWQKRPDGERNLASARSYLAWSAQNRSFESLTAISPFVFNLTGAGEPQQLGGARVSANIGRTLGISPRIGRTFSPEEGQPGGGHVVILSDSLWRRLFGGDPSVLGRTLNLNGDAHTIIGVLPQGFQFLSNELELWTPLTLDSSMGLDVGTLMVIGRLEGRVSPSTAAREIQEREARLETELPARYKNWSATLMPFQDYVAGDVRTALWMFTGAVGFVLLIAWGNTANLLLGRSVSRSREMAIQAAMGAGRARVVSGVIAEGALLGMAGGLAGLLLGWGAIRMLITLNPENLPRLSEIRIDGPTVLFALTISVLTGLVCGSLPAWQIARTDLNRVLKESSRSTSQVAGERSFRAALVIAEVALSLVLLTGAALLLRSFRSLEELNRGFEPDHILTLRLSIPKSRYPDHERIVLFVQALLDHVKALPGVEAAAASSSLPVDNARPLGMKFKVDGAAPQATSEWPIASCHLVSPDYFKATGITLLQGRPFGEHDNQPSAAVVIVSQSLAKRYFAGQNALGKRLIVGIPAVRESELPREIVGIARDVQYPTKSPESSAEIYLPYAQGGWPFIYLAIRTQNAPKDVMNGVRAQVRAVDREQPIYSMGPIADRIRFLNQRPQFNSVVAGIFAVLAIVLATIGIYGVISYWTRQRTQEIGVRVALGASPREILGLVLGQGVRLTAIGLAVGLAAYLAVARLIRSLLFGTSATDIGTIVWATGVLAAVAMLATYLPARRALRVDPATALRNE